MDTLSLWRLALNDYFIAKNFGGVFACNQLPEKRQHNSFIINLDKSNEPGSHWIALHFLNNTCFYFCSYGSDPKNKYINEFIRKNSKNIEWNKSLFQSLNSTTCGMFSLYFLHKICRFQKLDLVPTDTNYNEIIIKKFSKKIQHEPILSKDIKLNVSQKCCALIGQN